MSGSEEMKAKPRGVKLTYDDYVLFPDDGNQHELIDGEHFVTPAPSIRHQIIQANVAGLIWSHLQTHPVGRVFTARLDVVFSSHDVVEPDVLYISRERYDEITTLQNVQGAPDLVVEIGSPSTRTRDETIKKHLYEKFRVSEYWIVDPTLETVNVYRHSGSSYKHAAQLSRDRGDILTTPLLPGLELPLATIFDA
jgi:Uma2 family endonuclease